jgi:hypothetical protein
MDKKIYVNVICSYDINGNIRPIFVIWDNDNKYKIKRIINKENRASLKNGGSGIRYTCIFENNAKRYLFLDTNNKWFIERC